MNRLETFDTLDFDNQSISNEKINPKSLVESYAIIGQWHGYLPLDKGSGFHKLVK